MFDNLLRAGACLLSQAADYTSVQPIPRENIKRHSKALYFDANDGGFCIYEHYDNYSLTSADDTRDYQIFGVVGYMDFGFSQYLCVITDRQLAAEISNFSIWKILSVSMIRISRRKTMSLEEEEQEIQYVNAIVDTFSCQNCYYSLNFDLTITMQQAYIKNVKQLTHDDIFRHMNPKFCWNWHWIEPLIQDQCTHPYIVPVVCGYIDTIFISSIPLMFKSIMDRSRVGTRFWKRGANLNGDCVMDVTTELSLIHPNYVASYCIRRGSIPLLWRHVEVDPLYVPQINTSNSNSISSKRACSTHFSNLAHQFGTPITAIDILWKSESELSCIFAEVMGELNSDRFLYVKKNPQFLSSRRNHKRFVDQEFLRLIREQGFFLINLDDDQTFAEHCRHKQNGVFRVSSVECVDDTDVAQYIICKKAMVDILKGLGEMSNPSEALEPMDQINFEKLWMRNADALSRIYTGTISLNRSLESGYFSSFLKQLYIKISRSYLNCFTDQARQDKLNIFMNQLTDENNCPLISPVTSDIHNIRIQIRQAINKREFSNKFNIATFFFIQTWILPQKIDGMISFLVAIFWLNIYILYRLFGFKSNDLVRKTMSLQNINSK